MVRSITIRSAEEKDMPAIYDMICVQEKTNLNYAVMRAALKENLKSASCIYLVAESEQKRILGFAGLHMQQFLHRKGKTGKLKELFLYNGHGSSQVAALLVKVMKQIAQEQNCSIIETAVDGSTQEISVLANTNKHRTKEREPLKR